MGFTISFFFLKLYETISKTMHFIVQGVRYTYLDQKFYSKSRNKFLVTYVKLQEARPLIVNVYTCTWNKER